MENEENIQEGYLKGIIGAILGGLIATIPWVLLYLYGNMMSSVLAIIIAAGEFYGYKIFKGKIDKNLPKIIMIIAIALVTIFTFLVIPIIILKKGNFEVSFETIKGLYSISAFSSAIFKNYIMSLICTFLGVSIVTSNLRKQLLINPEKTVKLDLKLSSIIPIGAYMNDQIDLLSEAIRVIKPVFERYGAINSETTITEEEILEQVDNKSAKEFLDLLRKNRIIIKECNSYFYNIDMEARISKGNEKYKENMRDLNKLLIIIPLLLVVLMIIASIVGVIL